MIKHSLTGPKQNSEFFSLDLNIEGLGETKLTVSLGAETFLCRKQICHPSPAFF